MNKKILVMTLLAVAMLTTPIVGTAMAGKGQTRVSFRFVLVGTYGGLPAEILELGNATHILDWPFVATGWADPFYLPLWVEIDGVPIPPELLSYSGMLNKLFLSVSEGYVVMITETITIAAGDGYGAGTLELKLKGNLNRGNGVGNGDSFIGFGTGAYEGVKISGSSPAGSVQIGELDMGGGIILPITKHERLGTVMGWPTP